MTDDRAMIASEDCDAVEPFLSAFLDGELFGADRATVERHLVGCGRCRAVVEEYRQWGAALLVALLIGIGLWRPPVPERLVDIERLDAAGPVMVFTADEGRSAIIWLSEPEERPTPEPTST